MAARKPKQTPAEVFPEPIPTTPEEYENRLIMKSYRLVEERIDNGTATAAEIVPFIKAGSTRYREEMAKLQEENALLRAKTSAIESEKERAVFYKEVVAALKNYRTESTDVPENPYVF